MKDLNDTLNFIESQLVDLEKLRIANLDNVVTDIEGFPVYTYENGITEGVNIGYFTTRIHLNAIKAVIKSKLNKNKKD